MTKKERGITTGRAVREKKTWQEKRWNHVGWKAGREKDMKRRGQREKRSGIGKLKMEKEAERDRDRQIIGGDELLERT